MDEVVLDRLTLVTLFDGRTTLRSVSAYADVRTLLPGISYENPIGRIGDALLVIKPLREANDEDLSAL